jgi:predicted DNA-binding transcriptional regulator YafY
LPSDPRARGRARRAPPEGPRYDRAVELLALAIALQASAVGLAIEEIRERFAISRRTAERRLAALGKLFRRELTAHVYEDGRKHWRLRRAASQLLRVEPTEVAALDAAAALAEREGFPDRGAALRSLADKVRALDARPALQTDAEVLLESQGLAMRPGPRPKIPLDVVEVLREALLRSRAVRLDYRARIGGRETRRIVHPYGFLFGGRHYLVARDPTARELRLFSLADIRNAELLDRDFEREPGFDLRRFAERSFGVFQEEPRDVVWRFAPSAASAARDHVFHPTQRVEEAPDGSLVVRFRAGGLWEMAWHLFQWGGDVLVVRPPELRRTLREMLERSLAALDGGAARGAGAGVGRPAPARRPRGPLQRGTRRE